MIQEPTDLHLDYRVDSNFQTQAIHNHMIT